MLAILGNFVLMAPTPRALLRILIIFSAYSNEHEIIFKSLRTVRMVFCLRAHKNHNVQKLTLDGVELEFREEVTY